MEKYPRGRRGSPAKGVVCDERSEGSNPSFSAKRDCILITDTISFIFVIKELQGLLSLLKFQNINDLTFSLVSDIIIMLN